MANHVATSSLLYDKWCGARAQMQVSGWFGQPRLADACPFILAGPPGTTCTRVTMGEIYHAHLRYSALRIYAALANTTFKEILMPSSSSSDVFILSVARAAEPGEALRLAIHEAGLKPAKIQDLIFGWDGPASANLDDLMRQAGIGSPAATVSSSLRALFFGAQSILCEDADLVLVGGAAEDGAAALLLGSPSAVGIYNFLPLARIEAGSLAGAEAVLKKAALPPEETVELTLQGSCAARLAVELVGALNDKPAHWGMLVAGEAALLLERL